MYCIHVDHSCLRSEVRVMWFYAATGPAYEFSKSQCRAIVSIALVI